MQVRGKPAPQRLLGVIAFGVLLYLGVQHLAVLWEALLWFFGLVAPLFYGFCLAFVLNLLVVRVERWFRFIDRFKRLAWLKRAVSISLSLFIIAAVVALILWVVIPQIKQGAMILVANLPSYLRDFNAWAFQTMTKLDLPNETIQSFTLDWSHFTTSVLTYIDKQGDSLLNLATAFTGSILVTLLDVIIAIFTALYALVRKESCLRVSRQICERFLPPYVFKKLFHVADIANTSFSSYITGQLIEALIYATLVFIGMVIFGFPYPPVIAVLLFLTELVPVAGPWIGTLLATLIVLIIDPLQALFFLIFILILQQLESNLIYPKVVGMQIGLPDLLVLCAVVIGGNVGGVLGIIVSVPLCSVAYTLLREAIRDGRPKPPACEDDPPVLASDIPDAATLSAPSDHAPSAEKAQ